MINKNKWVLRILALVLFLSWITPAFPSEEMADFICEQGIRFYKQGRYDDALDEFNKALLVYPNYRPAINYINMIKEYMSVEYVKEETVDTDSSSAVQIPSSGIGVENSLDLIEIQKEMMDDTIEPKKKAVKKVIPSNEGADQIEPEKKTEKKVIPANENADRISQDYAREKNPITVVKINLNENLTNVRQPIEIEQGKTIIVSGNNIKRFLIVQPEILSVEQKNSNDLLVTGKDIGYTYLHIWDDSGRWSTEWLTIFRKPEGSTYDELLRKQEETASNFKLRYTLDWYSYYQADKWKNLSRSNYNYAHNLTLTGDTPYGRFDSTATIRTIQNLTDLTYYTIGLKEGKLWNFNDFEMRGFDFMPTFTNLGFPGETIRGVMFKSPVFNNKLTYSLFYGKEGGGRFGNLSPGLYKSPKSYLEGANISFTPNKNQTHQFSYYKGYGSDKPDNLKRQEYDVNGTYRLNKQLDFAYDVAQDTNNIAYTLGSRLNTPKIYLTSQFRNIDKDFTTITGGSSRQGELGALFTLRYNPTQKLSFNSSLDVYRDRLFPSLDHPKLFNEDFNITSNYQVDPTTAVSANFTLQNERGRLSEYRYYNPGVGFSKTIKWVRDIFTFVNYNYQDNKNYTSPASDYKNNRINAGLRFKLVDELYYYANGQMNWLKEISTGNTSDPSAIETGIDWSNQFGKTPFYGNFRLTYRNEANATSSLSFLAGEDYAENYTEISYRPAPDTEFYSSCRFRKVWPNDDSFPRRIEADFNAGMRYLWDTGLRWQSVGAIQGYVFKDYNSDGLRQRDDPPIEGVKIWLGKDKSTVTDLFGFYQFKHVKGSKAFVNIDTTTIPSGYILTVPVTQEAVISNSRVTRVDIGITSRSEISGYVFEDIDGDGQFTSKVDKPVAKVDVLLEDGQKVISNAAGRYVFANISPGEHTISLDLNTLPIYYLPNVAISQKIILFEGVNYIYSFPLKRIEDNN